MTLHYFWLSDTSPQTLNNKSYIRFLSEVSSLGGEFRDIDFSEIHACAFWAQEVMEVIWRERAVQKYYHDEKQQIIFFGNSHDSFLQKCIHTKWQMDHLMSIRGLSEQNEIFLRIKYCNVSELNIKWLDTKEAEDVIVSMHEFLNDVPRTSLLKREWDKIKP